MENAKSNSYFITHDVETAANVVNSLRQQNLTDEQLGVIGRRETLAIADLPEPQLTERSDVTQAAKRGASVGLAGGLLAGLTLSAFPPSGLAVGGGAVAAITAGGGALGTWAATMIGVSEKSELVKKFEDEIANDSVIVIADIEDRHQQVLQQVAANNQLPAGRYGLI